MLDVLDYDRWFTLPHLQRVMLLVFLAYHASLTLR